MPRRLSTALLLATLAVTLVACSSSTPSVTAPPALEPRTVAAGSVTVKVTPQRIDDQGAVFALVFDTHSGALSLDVVASTTLTVDGKPWPTTSWTGDGPGGHHRVGTLNFTSNGPPRGDVELSIANLPQGVNVSWTLDAP